MKKSYLTILFFIIFNSVFSQKNFSIQLALARGSSFSTMVNKEQISYMKVVPYSRFSYEGNIGYRINPKNRLSLGVVLNNYGWEVRMKSPNHTFKGREYYYLDEKYRLTRGDGYNVIFNLKYRTNIINTQKSALGISFGIGTYKTSSIIDRAGKFLPNNKDNYIENSNANPVGFPTFFGKPKSFMIIYSGPTFQYYYYWNFVPSIGLEYSINQKSNEIGIFMNASIATRKNYEFEVNYYENKNGDGLYVPPTETAKIVNRGLMLRAGLYYTMNHIAEKTKANPLKNDIIPWLKKQINKVPNDTNRTSKINIFYGGINYLPSSLIATSNELKVNPSPNNSKSLTVGFSYERRVYKLMNLGIGFNTAYSEYDVDILAQTGESIKVNEYFTPVQFLLFLNRNFYCLDKKVLLHTYVGTKSNLLISTIGQGGGKVSLLPTKDDRFNTRVFGKLAVSIPKYTKGLQFFVMYSGLLPRKLDQTGYVVDGVFFIDVSPFPNQVRAPKDFKLYYNPIYISFGIAYDFNISKRQKKIVEYY